MAYQHHPDWLISLKPNIEKTFVPERGSDVPSVTWRTNSLGMRGAEPSTNPDLRIVDYGDSNIHGRFSDIERTLVHQLERNIRERTMRDVEVLNGGIIGSGPDQALLRFKADIPRISPDIAVVHIFADNDFGDLVRNRIFDLDDAGRVIRTNHPAPVDSVFTIQMSRFLAVRAVDRLVREVREFLGLDGKLEPQQRLEAHLKVLGLEFENFRRGEPAKASHFNDRYDFDVAFMPELVSSQVKVQLMSGVMQEFANTARDNGLEIFFLIQPSSFDLVDHAEFETEIRSNYALYRPAAMSGHVEAICTDRGLDCLNLFGPFSQSDPDNLYWTHEFDRVHWNDRGQLLAADLLADFLAPTVDRLLSR